MTQTLVLQSGYMPLPRAEDGIQQEYLGFGVQFRTANGAMRAQQLGTRWRIKLAWDGLTQAERDLLLADYVAHLATTGTLVLPDGLACTYFTAFNTWQESLTYDTFTDTLVYAVGFTVEEA